MNEASAALPQGSSVHQEPESLAGTEGAAGKRKADAPQQSFKKTKRGGRWGGGGGSGGKVEGIMSTNTTTRFFSGCADFKVRLKNEDQRRE